MNRTRFSCAAVFLRMNRQAENQDQSLAEHCGFERTGAVKLTSIWLKNTSFLLVSLLAFLVRRNTDQPLLLILLNKLNIS